MNPRILVTVSRSYREISTMREVLEKVHANYPNAILVHGDDPDSDHKARRIWRGLGGVDEPHPAKWAECGWDCPHRTHRKIRRRTGEEYCPGAGLRRNTEMVETAPDMALAFIDPESRTGGARHCAQAAEDSSAAIARDLDVPPRLPRVVIRRRAPLKRTELKRKTELRRTGSAKLRQTAPSLGGSRRNGPVKARSESTHIPDPIRKAVLERDGHCCTRCGISLYGRYYSLHHRRRRGAGGSRLLHTMANLVALCGTGTTGCHGAIEANRTESYAFGWLVPNGVTPEQWPVFRHGVWQQPGETWTPCEPHPRQVEMLGEAA